jgi:hypothetical protein
MEMKDNSHVCAQEHVGLVNVLEFISYMKRNRLCGWEVLWGYVQ